jgi:PPOX class probable F420-dependent enzyme
MTALDTPSTPSPTLSPEARRFLEAPRYAVLATLNPDGSPLQAVVWYSLEGDTVVFNSRVGRRWPGNLARDRRASITVADGEDYVDLRGEVEIDEDPEVGQTVIAALARRYQPSRTAVEAQIAVFTSQRRVTFRLRPSKVFERLSGD